MDFSEPDLIYRLEAARDDVLDELGFGVVRLGRDGRVVAYNAYESRAAALSRERVLGRHFFTEIGSCMDNALVARRFDADGELDAEIDYLFTLRLKPTPVRLRLLKSPRATAMYLLVRR
jgi:photoactive yellow protein